MEYQTKWGVKAALYSYYKYYLQNELQGFIGV